MPKKRNRKGLCQRKAQKKAGGKKEPEELQKSDCAEPKTNQLTPYESGKTAGNVISSTSKDMIVDVRSKATSVSGLTSSEASRNVSEPTDVISVARNMVAALGTLGTPEEQAAAFELAMLNPVFRNLVNKKYIEKPCVTHRSVMPAPTPSAERKRKSRKKKAAVASILLLLSGSTQEEKNVVMKEVLEDEGASNAVLALGYIKKIKKSPLH